jgi:hypothetical protein
VVERVLFSPKTKWTGNADFSPSNRHRLPLPAIVLWVAVGAAWITIHQLWCGKGFQGGVFSVWENFRVSIT